MPPIVTNTGCPAVIRMSEAPQLAASRNSVSCSGDAAVIEGDARASRSVGVKMRTEVRTDGAGRKRPGGPREHSKRPELPRRRNIRGLQDFGVNSWRR